MKIFIYVLNELYFIGNIQSGIISVYICMLFASYISSNTFRSVNVFCQCLHIICDMLLFTLVAVSRFLFEFSNTNMREM